MNSRHRGGVSSVARAEPETNTSRSGMLDVILQKLALGGDVRTVDAAVTSQKLFSTPSLQRALGAVVLVGGLSALFLNRSMASQVAGELRGVNGSVAVLLVGLVVLQRTLSALMHRFATPGVSLGRMLLASESYAGASHSFTGGAGVGTALRVAMYRSWGVDGVGVAASVVAASVFPALAMWLIGGAYTIPLVLSGRADRNELLVGFGSVVFTVGPLVFWSLLLCHPASLRRGQQVAGFVGQRCARLRSRRVKAGSAKALEIAAKGFDDLRGRGRLLVAGNGLALITAAVAAQVILAFVPVVAAAAVAPQVSLPLVPMLKTFAMLRVMSSFVPVPGGIGIVDVGLIAVMEGAGMAAPEAFAAVALYRALTFLLPLMSGPVCAFIWWRRDARHQVLSPVLTVSGGELPSVLGAPARSSAAAA